MPPRPALAPLRFRKTDHNLDHKDRYSRIDPYLEKDRSYDILNIHYIWFGKAIPQQYMYNIFECYYNTIKYLNTKSVKLHIWTDSTSQQRISLYCHDKFKLDSATSCLIINFHNKDEIFEQLDRIKPTLTRDIKHFIDKLEHSAKPNYGAISDICRMVILSMSFTKKIEANLYIDTDERFCHQSSYVKGIMESLPKYGMVFPSTWKGGGVFNINNSIIFCNPKNKLTEMIISVYLEEVSDSELQHHLTSPKARMNVEDKIHYTVALTGPYQINKILAKMIYGSDSRINVSDADIKPFVTYSTYMLDGNTGISEGTFARQKGVARYLNE